MTIAHCSEAGADGRSSIRSMTGGDLPLVHALECLAQPDPWSRAHFAEELAKPYASIELCWQDGQLAGFICWWLVAGEVQIQNVATAPAFRRQGVAARLLAHVLKRAAVCGFDAAWLEVRVGNVAAITLYERFGFASTGRRPNYYPDGEDAIVMCYKPSDHKVHA